MKMKRNYGKRVLAVVCLIALLVSDIPVSVLASSDEFSAEQSPEVSADVNESGDSILPGANEDPVIATADKAGLSSEAQQPETEEAANPAADKSDMNHSVLKEEADRIEQDDLYPDNIYDNTYNAAAGFIEEEYILPEEPIGEQNVANVRMIVSRVEIGTDREVEISTTPFVFKNDAEVLTCRLESDLTISNIVYSWESQKGLVTIEPVPEDSTVYDMVLIDPTEAVGVDTLTIHAQYVDNDGLTVQNVSTSLEIEVWKERDISASVKVNDSEEYTRVEVGDTLSAGMTEDGFILGESDLVSFGFQWQVLEENESGEAEFVSIDGKTGDSYIPENRGIYRVCVTAEDDAVNYLKAGTWFSEAVEVLPVSVSVDLPAQEKVYDKSGEFLYEAEMSVTSDATGNEIAGAKEEIRTTLVLESADAGVYTGKLERTEDTGVYQYEIYSEADADGGERVCYGSLTLEMDPNSYEISSISDITIEIKPSSLSVELKASDKNFDNTTGLLKVPEVIWGEDEVVGEKKLVICEGETVRQLSKSDFVYTDKGDVDADTEVSIVPSAEALDLGVSIDGILSGNYNVDVRYDKSTIKKVTLNAEDAVSASGGFVDSEGKRWYGVDESGNAKAEVTAAKGFKIASELDGTYAGKTEVAIDTDGSASLFVRNSKNEIAHVTLEDLNVDKTAPSVMMENAKSFIFDGDSVKVTYSVTDEESGVRDIYYFVSEEDKGDEPTFDSETWTKVEETDVDQGKQSFEIKIAKTGYVYFHVSDNVGNSATSKQHMLVFEKEKPEKATFAFMTDLKKALHNQIVNVSVSDSEKNGTASGIQYIQYKLTEEGTGEDVTGDAEIRVKPNDYFVQNDNYSIFRKTAPKNESELAAALSMNAELTVGANADFEGTYVLTITAGDYCGNTSTAVTELVLDGSAPKVTVTKESAAEAIDGQYYYNADHAGFAVVIEDSYITEDGAACTVTVQGADPSGTISRTLTDADVSGTKGTFEFSTTEISALGDGKITISVDAKDAAGNATKEIEAGKKNESDPDGISVDGNKAEFILDTKSPEITDVVTEMDSNGNSALDTANGIVTYSAAFSTMVTIKDENIGLATLSVKPGNSEEDNGGTTSSASDSGIKITGEDGDGSFVVTYAVTKTGLYDVFEITGTDYAGNPLVLKQDSKNDKTDKWSVRKDDAGNTIGGVADYKKEYEIDGVGAEITYYKQNINNGKTTEELLEERHRREKTDESGKVILGYYNRTAVVQAVFSNLNERNMSKISVGMSVDGSDVSYVSLDKLSVKASESGFSLKKVDDDSEKYVLRYLCEKDGEYRISIKGDNLSGTPITVTEADVSDVEGSGFTDRAVTSKKPYTAHALIIEDKTAPVLLEADISLDNAEGRELILNTEYGNRYYVNTDYIANFTITEKYLDTYATTINIYRAHKENAENTSDVFYESQEQFAEDSTEFAIKRVKLDAEMGMKFDEKNSQVTFTDPIRQPENVSKEGVYDYLLYGEDIAGNALVVPDGLKNIEKNIAVEDENCPNVEKGFLTNPIVIDRKAPVGKIQISAKEGEDPFYVQDEQGISNPGQYISEKAARISVTDTSGDPTPYQISYVVNLKNGTKNRAVTEGDFSLAQESIYEVKGRQIFSVSDICLVDLAGNRSVGITTDNIYLDQDIDSDSDTLAPSIGVQPSHNIYTDKYGNYGEPLFNAGQNVRFDVKICDPYGPSTVEKEEQCSSGIATVSYGVYAVGTLTETEIEELVSKGDFSKFTLISKTVDPWKKNPLFAGSSDESEIKDIYEEEGAIKIPASVNRNDLMVVVTAKDNAGNTKRASYRFGIDRTTPEITLRYDNQSAENEKFFNAARTATLTVRDRNFDPGLVRVEIVSSAAGLDLKDAGVVKITDWKYTKGDASNGDDDIWEYKAVFANDGDYEVHIYNPGDEENILEDRAGNKGQVNVDGQTAPYKFVIDKTAPEVSILMSGEADSEDGHYYYRADNCGINIIYTDHGYNLATKGTEKDIPNYSVTIDDIESKAYVPDGGERIDTVRLSYTADEIAGRFNDGEHVIKVQAVDLAGNKADAVIVKKDAENTSCGCEFKDLTGTFILDKTVPRVVAINTVPVKGGTVTDNKVYSDTKSVYYNQNVNVVLRVDDEYVKTADYTTGIMKNGNAAEKASVKKISSGLSFTFSLTANNAYSGLTLSGKDKAGNLLVLDPDYTHYQASKVDELKDSGNGSVSAVNGKVIDDVNPVIRIRYVSEDNANLYSEEYKNRVSAYYNKNITAEYRITDNYELDGNKIWTGRANAAEGDKWAVTNPSIPSADDAASKNYNDVSYPITAEGVYMFTGYGTDRALNPVMLREMKPRTDANPADSYEQDVESRTGFTSRYVLIMDKTNPVFTLDISSPSSTNKKINKQGNRYYFNSEYTATATIKETNYDYRRISFLRGGVTNGTYNTEAVAINQFGSKIAGTTKIFKDKVTQDGVYRYALYGSDKAGNALVASNKTNMDGTSTAIVDSAAEKSRGSNEGQANTSNHIVLDTVAPAGQMDISNGQDTYYTLLTNGNLTLSEPYRQEQEAKILFTVDAGVERSPIRMTYAVDSTVDGLSQSGDTEDYQYSRSVSIEQKGRQQFKVTSFTMKDLAGNETKVASDNYIYLDMEPPTVDTLAPTINIVATAPTSVRSGQGQPLFNSDVPIGIVVTDPYGGVSSSGLADIQYDMYINGTLVSGDTVMLHGPNTKSYRQNYEDETLDYQYNGTVTVSSGSHNYNDLRVVVTASDNSGNRSTAEYTFGIDVTSPTIAVSYNNNNAQNGKYFKADRTATVVVTERNFDGSKINIQTEGAALINGWSHSSGASANGDDDTWTATISYTTDGEYHLAISGTDLLGNAAPGTQYNGVAPNDFVLDKTAPKITIGYDNNSVRNGKYYKADRTATVTVSDVNFDGTNNIVVKADANNKAPGVTFNGKVCSLPFNKDGIYQITGTVTDMAGNVSEVIIDPEFVLDKTMPRLMVEGVKDLSANRDPIKILLTMLDTNADMNGFHVDIKGTNKGNLVIGGTAKAVSKGIQYTVDTIDQDDYYTLVFIATDLAGNEVSQKMSFSENQHGTVFVFEQKEVEGKYTNKIFKPSFKLYNIDEVTILSVTLNGREVSYTYENDRLVLKDDLKSDGKYVITIDTKDAAGNTNSMDPVEFYVDRTKPVLTVTGVDKKQKYYFEEFDLVLIHDNPLDEFDQVELDGKVLDKDKYIVGKDGSITLHISEYGVHKLIATVIDAAGNISEQEVIEFVLTRNPIIRWYSNKPLFFGSLACMSAILVGLFIFLWKRRKEEEEG